MPLNLESDGQLPESWWKQTKKDIEKAKADFIASGRIGGNPWGYPEDTLKKDIKEFKK